MVLEWSPQVWVDQGFSSQLEVKPNTITLVIAASPISQDNVFESCDVSSCTGGMLFQWANTIKTFLNILTIYSVHMN
jgi:hypothetical protein